ncbi:AlpA-like transcriptional regulator [Mycobacterium phage RitSun]|nr:AlpA-like transcriptional regulator [Mycobacterium phage RitSun]
MARRLIAVSRHLDPPKDETRLYTGSISQLILDRIETTPPWMRQTLTVPDPEPWNATGLYRPPSLLTRIWWCIRG